MQTELARAKVNLTLHVGREIANQADPYFGYHPLDSLVVFADVADVLSCEMAECASEATLTISGPFGGALSLQAENLIIKAYQAAAQAMSQAGRELPALSFTLEKNLPVAAGIGGGSANAAAALRLMAAYADLPEAQWADIALKLGADVPVCRLSQTARMTGIGDTVTPATGLGQLFALLVNPGEAVATGGIFRAFESAAPKDTPRPQKPDGDLLSRLLDGRNDLEPVAIAQAPQIADCLRALASSPGCQIARMSGSGATCFGIYETQAAALKAAHNMTAQYPHWWVKPALLGDAI